jgi:hypothetical protein
MPLTEAEMDLQAIGEAEARLSQAKAMVEHLKGKLAVLPRNASKSDETDAAQAVTDAVAFVAVREKELVEILWSYYH